MIPKKLGDLFVNVSSKGVEATNAKLGMTEKKATMASKAAGMLKAALLGIGAYAIIRGLKSIITQFTDYTVSIDKFTKQTGIATGAIQRLVYAAEQEHASLESLNKGLMNLTVRLGYAGDGLETYLRYFRALGIEYRKADGTLKNTHDVFLDIADVVSKGKLNTEELAAVLQLFGARSGKELIPLLKKGKEWFGLMGDEAERLGIILDAKVIKQGKAFTDQMTAANAAARGLKYELAQGLLPTLNFVVKALTKAAAGWRAFFGGDEAREIENQNKLIAANLKQWKEWLDKKLVSQEQHDIAIRKLIKLNEYWKTGMEGTIPVIDDTIIGVDSLTESVKDLNTELIEWMKAEGTLFERLEEGKEKTKEMLPHMQEYLNIMLAINYNLPYKIEQNEEDIEQTEKLTEVMNGLTNVYNVFNIALINNVGQWKDWSISVRESIQTVIIKLLALMAIAKMLSIIPGVGGFGDVFKSIVSLGGLFQTPTGDAFAYREGRDFGRLFFGGFNEQLNGMIQGINTNQQPTMLRIYAEPGIIVERMSNMPMAYKSKFNRDVIKEAEELES